jgi:transcriptional regulator with GAF, ATPase, and Fis domain
MTIQAWMHFHNTDATSEQHILECLQQVGISSGPLDSQLGRGTALLFFSAITDDLHELIRHVSRHGATRLIAISLAQSALDDSRVWGLLESGASDVLHWCSSASNRTAKDIVARIERWHAIDGVLDSSLVRDNLVGQSPAWLSVLRQVIETARFSAACVLILGESGTGKELLASLIHRLDPERHKRELVLVDCTTIVPDLSGTEFFGHTKGAFTGATNTREGAFALADGGTLFLDEVGELHPKLQAELLRVVQEGTYKPIGSNRWEHTTFRLVCATNKDLHTEQANGRFRQDFYYRIANHIFRTPPLRERTDDILPLVEHFWTQFRPGETTPQLDVGVREYLLKRDYPGNVRDLRQLVSRISHRHVGQGSITIGDVPPEERPRDDFNVPNWRDPGFELAVGRAVRLGVGLKKIAEGAVETAMDIALAREQHNLQRAAQALKVTDRALQLRRAAWRQRLNGGTA